MEQIHYDFKTDSIKGSYCLLNGLFWVDVDQLGGRFYTVPLEDYCYTQSIGIWRNKQEKVFNDDLHYWDTEYGNSENNPIVLNTYWQRVLNGKVLRQELFFNTMMYSVYIRKGNKVKFKINK
jgi:hypothetical protein